MAICEGDYLWDLWLPKQEGENSANSKNIENGKCGRCGQPCNSSPSRVCEHAKAPANIGALHGEWGSSKASRIPVCLAGGASMIALRVSFFNRTLDNKQAG
jgi:hypothetical protein